MKNSFSQEASANNSNAASTGASPVVFTGNVPSVFSNEEFGSVRVIMKEDGEPLFCLKDVCSCLRLSNASVVASRIDTEEVAKLNLGALEGETTFVTESGLYDVILGSRSNEKTKPFKKWVTSEVLPSISYPGSQITLG